MRIEDARIDRDTELAVIVGALTTPSVMERLQALKPEHFGIDAHRYMWEEIQSLYAKGRGIHWNALAQALEKRKVSKTAKLAVAEKIGILGLDQLATVASARQMIHWSHLRVRQHILDELESSAAADPEAFTGILESLLSHESSAQEDTSWLRRGTRPMPEMISAAEMVEPAGEDVLIRPGLVIKQGVTLLTGPSKVGKSFMVLELARSLLTATDFLAMFPVEPRPHGHRVAYIQGELSDSQLFKRMQALQMGNRENLFLQKVRGTDFRLNTEMKHMGRATATGAERGLIKLADALRKRRVDVAIFDPLYCFLDGSELDEVTMQSAFRNLEALSETTDTAVILVHHNRKSRPGDQLNAELASGHSILHREPVALLTVINHVFSTSKPRIRMTFQLRCAEPIDDVEILSKDGKWWAVPWASDVKLLVYNTVAQSPVPIKGADVVTALEGTVKKSQVYLYLKKLREAGELEYSAPVYWVAGAQGVRKDTLPGMSSMFDP